MPVYESTKNADNKIVVSAQSRDSVIFADEARQTFLKLGCRPQPDSY